MTVYCADLDRNGLAEKHTYNQPMSLKSYLFWVKASGGLPSEHKNPDTEELAEFESWLKRERGMVGGGRNIIFSCRAK